MSRKNFQIPLLFIAWLSLTGIVLFFQPAKSWLEEPLPSADSVLQTLANRKASMGTKENPEARLQWELMMLRDPATDQIPRNIHIRELEYARKLPVTRQQGQQLRKKETPWLPAGPYNVAGRTRALAIDAENENYILAAGVSGGMWRSENGGLTWVKTTNPQQLQSVTCLVQDPRPGQRNIWYYGSGELIGNSARGGEAPYRGDGIYKSIDGGRTWLPLPATSTNRPDIFDQPFDYIFNLKINPANLAVQELYAAAFGGIYKSVDGGLAWTRVLGDGRSLYTDVEITQNGTIYATISTTTTDNKLADGGLFRSVNGGLNWERITPQGWPTQFGRTVMSANPQNPNEVYFLGFTIDSPVLWRYRQGNWLDLSVNLPEPVEPVEGLDLQGGYNMVVKVHPGQPQTVFLGGTNLYRSSNGFTSATETDWIGGYSPTNDVALYPNQHPDQHALVFYPSNPARAIAGHDGGLSRTENILADPANEELPVSWTELNTGYNTTQFYTVGLDQNQVNDLIIGGMQDNGSFLTAEASAPASTWIRVLGGDGGYTYVANKGAFYYVSFQEAQIYRLRLNDQYVITSFARIDPPGAGQVEDQAYLFINPYVFDPNNQNIVFLAAGDVVYRNFNVSQIPAGSQKPSSVNWERLEKTNVNEGSISAITISNIPSNVLYYGTSGGKVFKVVDASLPPAAVEVIDISSQLFPDRGYVANITVNPINADEVIVVFSNYNVVSIFRSMNGGRTFESISGNLEEFPDGQGSGPSVRHVEIVPLENGNTLYLAGTSAGLYATRSDGFTFNSTWTQEAPLTIGRVVVPQIRHRVLDGRVVVATHGNGVYFKNYDGVLNYMSQTERQEELYLGPPYPNPYIISRYTRIRIPFGVPRDGIVRVRVYDMKGQLIRHLFYDRAFGGVETTITWDGLNGSGSPVAAAAYLIRMEYEDQTLSTKVLVYR